MAKSRQKPAAEEPPTQAEQNGAQAAPPDTPENGNGEKRRPIVSYKLPIGGAALEVAIWSNTIKSQHDGSDVTVYNVTVGRSYKTDEGWKTGGGFRTQELAPLRYLIDKALSWILSTKCEDSAMPF